MACPFFEPLMPIASSPFRNARLPLLEPYAGRCCSRPDQPPVEARSCNQGYPAGCCEHFPHDWPNQANRYSFAGREQDDLRVLFIREENHSPAETRTLHFSVSRDCLTEADLDPLIASQALAFCRSFVRLYAPNR
jgi:hypothetical protein